MTNIENIAAVVCLYGSNVACGYAFIASTPDQTISRGRTDDGMMSGQYTSRTEALYFGVEAVKHELGIKSGTVRVFDTDGVRYCDLDARLDAPIAGSVTWSTLNV